jgi:hypothetical protein
MVRSSPIGQHERMAESLAPGEYRSAEAGEFPGFERALELVAADVKRTWPRRDAPDLELVLVQWTEVEGGIQVAIADGGWYGNAIPVSAFPDEGPGRDPVAAVADLAQETLMEWRGFRVWPVCDSHDRGLHASTADGSGEEEDIERPGPAHRWCSAVGGHRVAEVGRLGLHER